MIETTLNVPFVAVITERPDGFAFVQDLPQVTCHAPESKARRLLRTAARERIAEGMRALENTDGLAIGCIDGTVLIVRFSHDTWGYSITGPGRAHSSGCTGCARPGTTAFDDACQSAREHAAQSYGGVLWECRLI